jgi:murein hydrolase activator
MVCADSHKRDRLRSAACGLALALCLATWGGQVGQAAEDTPALATPPAASEGASSPAQVDPTIKLRENRIRELQAIEQSLAESDSERKRIEEEIGALRADREKLQRDLVTAATKVRDLEEQITDAETRLDKELLQEQALKASLESRRDLIGHVLAALQRIGGKPPPAVIVSAQDILATVRASIVLGSVLPQLRGEARALSEDLAELVRLKGQITAERDELAANLSRLRDERARLASLVEARRTTVATDEAALGEAGKRAASLTAKAKSLRDFLVGLDADIAQSEKKAADQRKQTEALIASTQSSFTAASLKEPTKLNPKVAFAEARGLLPLPVSGSIARDFGDPDEVMGTTRGVSIATRVGAVVSSPSEGVIAHAGPFRGYGQLLIINAGNGYHIVLAGMGHIDVTVGQPVLAGEPVGGMGDANMLTTDAGKPTSGGPVLYVEFRKDGSAINPSPWWARTDQRKVRG